MSSSSSRSGSSGSASTSASDAEYLKSLQSQSINREKAIANILGEPENFIYDEKLKRWVLGEKKRSGRDEGFR